MRPNLDREPSALLAYDLYDFPPYFSMTPPPLPRSHALRFISGKYQGGEFPLPESGEVVIGRSSELDMVLVEDMVSRRHAKITVTSGQMFLQDLGSTNGSFINGEKIERARLNKGDRILIGTSIIKVVATDGGPNLLEAQARLHDVAFGKLNSQVRTMTGSIAEVPLPDVLQLFGASKKSGTLVVRTVADVGHIYLDKGRVVFATVNDNFDALPEKSFYRIITWDQGTFDLEGVQEIDFPRTIKMSTEGLLMEAMRQLDEAKRLGPDMPSPSASVRIASNIVGPLRELTASELDVLQLAHNHGVVGSVLDRSAATDLDTSSIFVKLIRAGYLEIY